MWNVNVLIVKVCMGVGVSYFVVDANVLLVLI
jgi:hypothetical protein